MSPSPDSSPTPEPGISPSLLRVAWMADPLLMANRLTRGRFAMPPHLVLLSRAVARTVATGGRLLVEMPPRHGKSETCSVWTPVWLLNAWPRRRVILTSYEADFAAGWGRKARNLIEEHRDQLLVRLSEDSTAANRWNTPEGGGMVTAGVGGAITGRGADLLLVDDPHKNAEEAYSQAHRDRVWEWWTSTALTRLEPGAAVILIQTRWHEDDLAGRVLREDRTGRWTVIRLPALAEEGDPLDRPEGAALWPERFDAAALAEARATVGSRVWFAMYQQAPAPDGGGLFKAEWMKHRYEDLGGGAYRLEGGQVVRLEDLRRHAAVDLAASARKTADFTVIATVGVAPDRRLLVLDVDRARREGPDVVPAIRAALARWGSHVAWVEKAGFQIALIQEAQRAGLPVREALADRDKVARALPLTAAMEGGRVLLPTHAPWLYDLEAELLAFPRGRHDDQVDALGYACAKATATPIRVVTSARTLPEDDDGLEVWDREARLDWHRHQPRSGRSFARPPWERRRLFQ